MTSSLYSLLWNSPCRDTWEAERPAGPQRGGHPAPEQLSSAARPQPGTTRPLARPPVRPSVRSPEPAAGSTAEAALRLPCSSAAARASQMPPRPPHMSPEPPPPRPAVRRGRAAAPAASAPLKRCSRPPPPRAPTRDSAPPPRERSLGRAARWPPRELHPCAARRWPQTPSYLIMLSTVCYTHTSNSFQIQSSWWKGTS